MNKNIIRFAIITVLILLIPFFGNMHIEGWNWSLSDFVIAGIFLFGTGVVYELISKRSNTTVYRAAVAVGVVTALVLAWMNGAVGIIGSENNPANLLYAGVYIILIVGSTIALLKPRGMSYTLFAVAVAQMLVPTTALLIWKPDFSPGVIGVFTLNAFFATFWVVSGLLFRRAAQVGEGAHA